NVQLAQAGTYSVRVTNAFGSVLSSNAILSVNRPPVADASATPLLVTVPPNCDPIAVLDGSRSSDPDNDPLHFFWFLSGTASPIATGIIATVNLPIGENQITLVVDDGLATNSQTVVVEVITSADAVGRFIALVDSQAAK